MKLGKKKEKNKMNNPLLKFLPIAAAVLLATSCSKDDNDNAPTSGKDGVHTVATNTIPFSIRVKTGHSLKKVGYAESTNEGEKGWYNITFSNEDVANQLKMIIKENGTQIGEATLQSDKATFSGNLTQQPSSNASLTAEISVSGSKNSSNESLADLLASCSHNFIGEFKFGDKTVDLTDQNAYLAISMSPCCEHKITINSDDYTVKDGRIWISVPASANVTSTGLGEEISKSATEVVPGTIYTVARQYFSVSPTKKVYFSKGNLQYNPAQDQWQFASTQYEHCFGSGNVGYAYDANYDGWIDLFGWGTWLNGNDVAKPYETQKDDATAYKWSGSSAIGSEWETLTGGDDNNSEWNYLLERSDNLCHTVYLDGSIFGLIILPDSFEEEDTDWDVFWSANFDLYEWSELEKAGAVFLPAASPREGSKIDSFYGQPGSYWSSSVDGEKDAYCLSFHSLNPEVVSVYGGIHRYSGYSVRLVRPL